MKVNAGSVEGNKFLPSLLSQIRGEMNQHVRVRGVSCKREPEDHGIINCNVSGFRDQSFFEGRRNLRNQVLAGFYKRGRCKYGGNAAHDLEEIASGQCRFLLGRSAIERSCLTSTTTHHVSAGEAFLGVTSLSIREGSALSMLRLRFRIQPIHPSIFGRERFVRLTKAYAI